MAGGGGMSSEVSGIERLRANLSRGGVRNPCFSSSVVPLRNKAEEKNDMKTWGRNSIFNFKRGFVFPQAV